jgi:tetratricopeptide (TPR) repeat protein
MINLEQAQGLYLTGKSLYDKAELDEAIVYFQRAIELNFQSFWAHHLLGCSFDKVGKQNEAIAAWQQAIKVDDNDADKSWAYYHIALAKEKQGNVKEAIDYCQQAIQVKSDRSDFVELLSRLNSCRKEINNSSTAKADCSNESNPQILYLPVPNQSASDAISMTFTTSRSEPFLAETLPVPPKHIMEYGESPEYHLLTGQKTVTTMIDVVQQSGNNIANSRRILEFGCANARLLRWLANLGNHSEIWGVDIQSDKIFWAIENLNPPFNFAVNTTVPHLPFRDGYFDFIFAGSIFTHINELHIAWLLELTRLLSPNGLLYLTFHDEHTLKYLKANPEINIGQKLSSNPLAQQIFANEFDFVSVMPYSKGMLSQVFMSSQYIQQITKSYLKLISVTPNAYSGLQTGYLFASNFSL